MAGPGLALRVEASFFLDFLFLFHQGKRKFNIFDMKIMNRISHTYQPSHHPGNVRVTFARDDAGQPELLSHYDYYPYGMPMPGRQLNPANHRYGYQGEFAEKDRETGFNHFEARLWDSRTGRWMIPDPAGQFHSPYLGMGNSPIIGIDPDGRKSINSYWNYEAMHQEIKNIWGRREAEHENYLENHLYGGSGGLIENNFSNEYANTSDPYSKTQTISKEEYLTMLIANGFSKEEINKRMNELSDFNSVQLTLICTGSKFWLESMGVNTKSPYSMEGEPGYKAADLGANDALYQIAYSLSYIYHSGKALSTTKAFDWKNAERNFKSKKGQPAGEYWLSTGKNVRVGIYKGDDVIIENLKYHSPSRGDQFTLDFGIDNLNKSNFPGHSLKGINGRFTDHSIEYPYQIKLSGKFDKRSSSVGLIRFNNWNSFVYFNSKIYNGPQKGYWFNK